MLDSLGIEIRIALQMQKRSCARDFLVYHYWASSFFSPSREPLVASCGGHLAAPRAAFACARALLAAACARARGPLMPWLPTLGYQASLCGSHTHLMLRGRPRAQRGTCRSERPPAAAAGLPFSCAAHSTACCEKNHKESTKAQSERAQSEREPCAVLARACV